MANFYEMSEEGAREYEKWLAERPALVRKICERLPPNKLYRMKTTGQRVTLHSVNENGTVTVDVTAEYNLLDFETQVFGVDPGNLEECDLPKPDEPVGVLLEDPELVAKYIEAIRPHVLAARRADPNDPFGKKKQ